MTKRLFVAIKYKPDNKVLDLIKEFKIDLKDENIKWVDTDNMHLTLKFYGDTQISKISELTDQLNRITENFSSNILSTEKLDAFYRGKFPSVLVLKLKDNNELSHLAESISIASEACGFPMEKRFFKAHITLARIKYIEDLQLFKDMIQIKADQHFRADSFLLYESKLTQKGPIYSVLEEFVFRKS